MHLGALVDQLFLRCFQLQMAALLQMSTGRADAQHLERLQEQLYEARSEVDVLTKKLALHSAVKVWASAAGLYVTVSRYQQYH